MKWIWVLLASLATSLVLAQGWKTVSSKEAGLQFSMPSAPKPSTREDKDGDFAVQTRMWTAQGNANYVVSVSFIPPNAPSQFIPNMITGIKQGFLRTTSGKVVSEKPATYAGVTGKEIVFTTAGGAKGSLWIITRKLKVITLTVAKQGDYQAERKKFFGSLKLTN
jgi:hypothetical protein